MRNRYAAVLFIVVAAATAETAAKDLSPPVPEPAEFVTPAQPFVPDFAQAESYLLEAAPGAAVDVAEHLEIRAITAAVQAAAEIEQFERWRSRDSERARYARNSLNDYLPGTNARPLRL